MVIISSQPLFIIYLIDLPGTVNRAGQFTEGKGAPFHGGNPFFPFLFIIFPKALGGGAPDEAQGGYVHEKGGAAEGDEGKGDAGDREPADNHGNVYQSLDGNEKGQSVDQ